MRIITPRDDRPLNDGVKLSMIRMCDLACPPRQCGSDGVGSQSAKHGVIPATPATNFIHRSIASHTSISEIDRFVFQTRQRSSALPAGDLPGLPILHVSPGNLLLRKLGSRAAAPGVPGEEYQVRGRHEEHDAKTDDQNGRSDHCGSGREPEPNSEVRQYFETEGA